MHEIVASFETVDALLHPYESVIGRDFAGYRNHVTRVLNFTFAIAPSLRQDAEVLYIAAAFHDVGIWTDHTFDYLAPSEQRAAAYCAIHGLAHRTTEVNAIIEQHHKLRPYTGEFAASVDAFRRADLVDVSLGIVREGLDGAYVRAVQQALPDAGFHWRLIQLTARQLLRTPLSPIPVLRW